MSLPRHSMTYTTKNCRIIVQSAHRFVSSTQVFAVREIKILPVICFFRCPFRFLSHFPVKAHVKLQALVFDILPSLEEGAGKRCSKCGPTSVFGGKTQPVNSARCLFVCLLFVSIPKLKTLGSPSIEWYCSVLNRPFPLANVSLTIQCRVVQKVCKTQSYHWRELPQV